MLEAWANATPVVLPAHGAFPEMIADAGGGLLHEPLDAESLAAQLIKLLKQPEHAAELGRRGQQAVADRYHAARMAEATRDLYSRLV